MEKNEYKCGHCCGIFEKGWSDEEAKAEATEIFGKNPDEWRDEQVVICDGCFQKVNPRAPENADKLEKARARI